MKTLPSLEDLGLKFVQDNIGRVRNEKTWQECIVRKTVGGMHVLPYFPVFLGHGIPSLGTFDLVRLTIRKAESLGFEVWMCNDDPKNGGFIREKTVDSTEGI